MENKPKPIFTIGIPLDPNLSPEEKENRINQVREECSIVMRDYHVLVYPTIYREPQFKAFYANDFEETDLDKLKQFIKEKNLTV